MKFPLLANAFGQQKLILEIGGNAVGVSEPRHQPQRFRRHRAEESEPQYQPDRQKARQIEQRSF